MIPRTNILKNIPNFKFQRSVAAWQMVLAIFDHTRKPGRATLLLSLAVWASDGEVDRDQACEIAPQHDASWSTCRWL